MSSAVEVSDLGLVRIHQALDFLFQITPVNTEAEWKKFKSKNFDAIPHFQYHPKSKKLLRLKQELARLPIQKLDDPLLRRVFREKYTELDRKIEMLDALGTPAFLEGSLEIYCPANDHLARTAKEILERFPPPREILKQDSWVTAQTFAKRAREEINAYRKQDPKLRADIQIRSDCSDLMVSNGRLLVGKKLRLSLIHMEALIQHEVGTHLLTFWNGSRQPFRLMGAGLAGYEELQEGLAVLSEYLAGGLDLKRLRVLAGRVIAARSLSDGAVFMDSFRLLYKTHGFDAHSAFLIASRVHRAGGLTKDAIYLRGFLSVLEFLKKDGPFDVLWMGKIALSHVLLIQDLLRRGLLSGPCFRPRYLERPESAEKLAHLRECSSGLDVLNLLIEEGKEKCRQ